MHLCRCLSAALVGLAALALVAAEPQAEDKKKEESPPAAKGKARAALEPGKDLPGPFHPFNVNGPRKNNFHCVVSGQGLDPLVLLFVRDMELTDTLKDLLRRLDAACVKNPNLRLACAAVFLPDDLKDRDAVIVNDDKRDDLAAKLAELADAGDMKLQKVVLCLDDRADVEKYDLEREEATCTLVLANKAKVVATEFIQRDKLTPEKVDAIVKLLADKLGAVRK